MHSVEGSGHRLRLTHVQLDTDGVAPDRLDSFNTGRAMFGGPARDAHSRTRTCELDGDGFAESGATSGHQCDPTGKRVGRQHRRACRRRRHDPSNSTGCFAAFAAYPFGMSSETNSTDALIASNRSASANP